MPRIKAGSVAEHVAQQEAAVFATAVRLFRDRGYADVTLADIAAEIGLARNSLYRYFPDKAHILLRWLQYELPRQVDSSARLLRGDEPPGERIERWAVHQLDYAATDEHALLAQIGSIVADLDPDTRAELARSHERLLDPLLDVLGQAGVPRAERRAVAAMIQQLVLAAAMPGGRPQRAPAAVRRRLLAGIRGLIG